MATKFYFQNRNGASVEVPPTVGWTGAANIQRFMMYPEKGTSPVVVGRTISTANAGAGSKELDRQYISPPLKGAQVISGYASGFLQVTEFVTNDNVDQIISSLRLCSEDGKVMRSPTGWLVSGRVPVFEFSVTTTYTNRAISSGAAGGTNQLINPMTGQDGDRLVLEIGYGNSTAGTSPQAAARWGDNAPDVSGGQLQTVAGAGWFSLGQDLVFYRNPTSSITV